MLVFLKPIFSLTPVVPYSRGFQWASWCIAMWQFVIVSFFGSTARLLPAQPPCLWSWWTCRCRCTYSGYPWCGTIASKLYIKQCLVTSTHHLYIAGTNILMSSLFFWIFMTLSLWRRGYCVILYLITLRQRACQLRQWKYIFSSTDESSHYFGFPRP